MQNILLTHGAGLAMNHNAHLADLKRKIRTEICEGLGMLSQAML